MGSKRIFILGPSHHFHLTRCALSRCAAYQTPLGDVPLDLETIAELQRTNMFDTMTKSVDEDEHSIEMQLPYIHKMIARYRTLHAEDSHDLKRIPCHAKRCVQGTLGSQHRAAAARAHPRRQHICCGGKGVW